MLHSQLKSEQTPEHPEGGVAKAEGGFREAPLEVMLLGGKAKAGDISQLARELEERTSWRVRLGEFESALASAVRLAAIDLLFVRASAGTLRSFLLTMNAHARKGVENLPAVLLECEGGSGEDLPEDLEEGVILQVVPPGTKMHQVRRQILQLGELRWNRRRVEEICNAQAQTREEALQILRIVAHDIRGPLHSLRAFPQMLRMQLQDTLGKEGLSAMEDMENDVSRLHTGMEDLLHWSMVQLHDAPPRPEPVNLYAIGREAAKFATNLINKEHRINIDLPEDLVLQADPDLLKIALRNLISNALKFTPREGEIRICCEKADGNVLLHVEDTGVGISEKQQGRLFQLRKRVRSRGTENEKGSGMGLILCRDILRRQGGDLRIESREGQGTRATIILPDAEL